MKILKRLFLLICMVGLVFLTDARVLASAEELVINEDEMAIDEDASADLVIYGDASKREDGAVELTPLKTWQSGSVWYGRQIAANGGFYVKVDYWAGGGRDDSYGGADGIVVTFAEKTGLGSDGEYLGFVPGSYGVELDSYVNSWGEPSGKHIAVIKEDVTNHLSSVLDDRVDDSQWHTLELEYTPGTLSVYLDGESVIVQQDVNLADKIYLGISAATGSGYNQHLIRNFYMKGVVSEEKVVMDGKDIQFKCSDMTVNALYSDSFFADSSYNYNHNLARLTLGLELSSWTADESIWGEEGADNSRTAQKRYANIEAAYKQMGFESMKFYNYGISLNEIQDKVAFSIAKKQDVYGATLVAVVIRGGGYGGEWSSNFNVGTGELFHDGFNSAAEKVYRQVLEEISTIEGNIKLWITGYSRGAATANLLSAKLNDYARQSAKLEPADIFAYTFATPQGVTVAANANAPVYNNIFNIVNPGDAVPLVAPSRWHFTRYGVTRYFDSGASKDVIDVVNILYYYFAKEHDFDAKDNIKQSAAGSALLKIVTELYPTADKSMGVQRALREVFEMICTRKWDASSNAWTKLTVDDMYVFMAERYGDAFWSILQYVENLLNTTVEGKALLLTVPEEKMEYVRLVLVLIGIYGEDVSELLDQLTKFFESKDIEEIAVMAFDIGFGFGGLGTAHTAPVYLAWMQMYEEDVFGNVNYADVDASRRGTTVVRIACPVDIAVYDQDGEKVATIVNHQIVEAEIPVIIDGEATELYFAAVEDSDYTIEVIATDDGAMTCTVTELGVEQDTLMTVKYNEVPLRKGQVFTQTVETYDSFSEGKYDLSYKVGETEVIISADDVIVGEYKGDPEDNDEGFYEIGYKVGSGKGIEEEKRNFFDAFARKWDRFTREITSEVSSWFNNIK